MNDNSDLEIGVLALQGDFDAHKKAVEAVGARAILVRAPEQVATLDGLILPGGESTTIGKLMARFGLDTVIVDAARAGLPVFGTCAGMILMANRIASGEKIGGQPTLGLMDISVRRNAFGRQIDSFETNLAVPDLFETPMHVLFIRAPLVESVGDGVDVLASVDEKPVLVRQNHCLAAAFHPELTGDFRLHEAFLTMARDARSRRLAEDGAQSDGRARGA